MMEQIYIVVPVYKVEAYLDRCIDSILNQTYTNWELVLVDDGSPDGSGAICDRYGAQDSRIHVIHQENGGLSAARNTAVAYARQHGDENRDWISFIDSDDFIHPRYLEYLYRAAKETGLDISSCGYVRTKSTKINNAQFLDLQYETMSPEAYWCRNCVNGNVAWGKLYRLFLFRTIRFPVGKLYEDVATTYKILYQYSELAVIPAPMYYWYDAPNSITTAKWTPKRLDYLTSLDAQLAFFTENGYTGAYHATLALYVDRATEQYRGICAQSPTYDDWKRDVKNRRNQAVKRWVAAVGIRHIALLMIRTRVIQPIRYICNLSPRAAFSFIKRKLRRK